MIHSQTIAPPAPSQPFRRAFCERFAKPNHQFEEKLFWDAVDPGVRPICRIIRFLNPGFFQVDFDFIHKIADAESKREVARIVNGLPYDPRFNRGFLRGFLRVRISGRRLVRIADRLFAESNRHRLP